MHTHLQNHFARIFATNPAVPSPVAPEALEALRVRADIEHLHSLEQKELNSIWSMLDGKITKALTAAWPKEAAA